MKKLPPLGSLVAFIEAAEQQSFTKAAKNLNVTQGAISKQIGVLENYLETELFERRHQSLIIKTKAKNYAKELRNAFNIISKATDEMSSKSDAETLTINILPSITIKLVAPIMREFSVKYNVNIENGSGYEAINFLSADVAIRIGKIAQKYKGCVAENLINEKLVFVCSPSYQKRHRAIKKPEDFILHDLLNNSSRPLLWVEYLKNFTPKNNNIKYKGSFEHLFMLLEATKDGLGIAMLPDFMASEDLKNGKLVLAINSSFNSGYCYQLIYPNYKSDSKKIIHFANWIKHLMRGKKL